VPFDPSQLVNVSREDAEQILDRFSLNEIAEAWFAYHATKDKRHCWAVDLLWSDPYLDNRDRREKLIELLIETLPLTSDRCGGRWTS
jgi:hypothetical protein